MYERVELKDGYCPDCGGEEYWEGPSGGASINICCMSCLSAFNIGPGNFAERIPNIHFVQGGAVAQPREAPTPLVEEKRGWLT